MLEKDLLFEKDARVLSETELDIALNQRDLAQGWRSLLIMVDEFYRFNWLMFIWNKNEEADEIISLIKQCEVLYDLKVKQLRIDHGTEFHKHTL